jgi:hypothetical protein
MRNHACVGLFNQRTPDQRLQALQARYSRLADGDDLAEQDRLLRAIVELDPDAAWAWFDLGLRAKWRRDWAACAELNERALAAGGDPLEDPAAWNLGIAATALGDWDTARRAWAAYGIELPAGRGPIQARLGQTPIRLNPEPRYPGETPLRLGGETWEVEVVWCERLDPARAMITNVPTPESGHAYGDIVLHDGEPVGERTLGDATFPVFNELDRLVASRVPTLSVEVTCPTEADSDDLSETFAAAGLAAEDWTSSFRVLCRACSEGNPDLVHDHDDLGEVDGDWSAERWIGVAADEPTAVTLLDRWAAGAPGRAHDVPERVF